MPDFETLCLAGSGIERKSRLKPKYWLPDYQERFDGLTLWLDAVWTGSEVLLICPRLNNQRGPMRRAQFSLDGKAVSAKFRYFYRHCVVTLAAPDKPEKVRVTLDDWSGESCVNAADLTTFANKNVLFTLSKNNDLTWIRGWARFHKHHHQADAVLFVDNGSSNASKVEIEACLREVGFDTVVVLQTHLKYGPRGKAPFRNSELFLQTGIMNALRHRLLWPARAVLNCDVDELVMRSGETVFDRAVASRFGFVSFPGMWVYPAAELGGMALHKNHVFNDVPPKACPPKWCIVPSRALHRFQWRAHELEGLPLKGRFLAKDMTFLHCRQITDGWKSLSRLRSAQNTAHSDVAQRALRLYDEN